MNIAKGKFFVAPEHIRGTVDDMARALSDENHLKQLPPLQFADRLTDYYNYLNTGGSASSSEELFHGHES